MSRRSVEAAGTRSLVRYPLFQLSPTAGGPNLMPMPESLDELTAQIKQVLETGQTWYGDFDPHDEEGMDRARTAGRKAAAAMKRKVYTTKLGPDADGLMSICVVLTGQPWANNPDYDDE